MTEARTWNLIAVTLVIGLTSALTYSCGAVRFIVVGTASAAVLKHVTDRDEFFNIIAVDFREPSLCDRIDWSPFPRATDFHDALREAGYPDNGLPRVAGPTPEDYWEFVGRLIHRAPASERAEFLRRVAAIE